MAHRTIGFGKKFGNCTCRGSSEIFFGGCALILSLIRKIFLTEKLLMILSVRFVDAILKLRFTFYGLVLQQEQFGWNVEGGYENCLLWPLMRSTYSPS